jgi:RNA polymerase sigma factor (TIGR02999 family)
MLNPEREISESRGGIISVMTDVTQILSQIESGDPNAAEQLLPLVYEELRKLAAAKLAQEKPGQTLQATSLVHEAYIRLVDGEKAQHWNSRGHFFGAAAEAMRRILIMSARRRCAEKRGGGRGQIELDPSLLPDSERDDRLVALDEALTRLEQQHPEKAQLVKLRFYSGLTIADAAAAMGISDTTADRHWAYARAWIQREVAAAGGSRSD